MADRAVLFLSSMNRGNVRMVQGAKDFGFALKPRQPFGITGHGGRQDLDRHLSLEARVGGAKHFAHAAFAEFVDDFVGAEARARCERHLPERL